jgi:hypothetical protein
MILEGPSIDCQSDVACVPASLFISQILVFNAVKYARKASEVTKVGHSSSQETSLPLYLSLMLHAETRKRDLIDKVFALGLCVSYDRVLQVSASLGNRLCDNFDNTSGVKPPGMANGVFITAAIDHIDHNPSATSASSAFHGTAISVFQHFVLDDTDKIIKADTLASTASRSVKPLPSNYTRVK